MLQSPLYTKPTFNSITAIKFLCSYGGRILPRYPDGKLRYLGGETRVLAVDRSISFSELLLKLGELSGGIMMTLRCQLPMEDLDALVSITSDEDLANLIEEYDRSASSSSTLKIRAFLSPFKTICNRPLPDASSKLRSTLSSFTPSGRFSFSPANRCVRQISTSAGYILCSDRSTEKIPYHYAYYAHGNPSHSYLIHNGNHWQ